VDLMSFCDNCFERLILCVPLNRGSGSYFLVVCDGELEPMLMLVVLRSAFLQQWHRKQSWDVSKKLLSVVGDVAVP
jgi:hypothetical protein